jgi:hypothetical protein
MPFERVKDNSIQPMACTGCGNVFDVKTKDLDSGKVNPFTLCIASEVQDMIRYVLNNSKVRFD